MNRAIGKGVFRSYANNEGPDQLVHPHSLIGAFAVNLQNHWLLQNISMYNVWANSHIRLCGFSYWSNPAGTWRLYNVGSTSMQRHDVASTLRRRCINVMCLLGKLYCSHMRPFPRSPKTHAHAGLIYVRTVVRSCLTDHDYYNPLQSLRLALWVKYSTDDILKCFFLVSPATGFDIHANPVFWWKKKRKTSSVCRLLN